MHLSVEKILVLFFLSSNYLQCFSSQDKRVDVMLLCLQALIGRLGFSDDFFSSLIMKLAPQKLKVFSSSFIQNPYGKRC